MSLIVEINPVPWKILELVKARILKNRAKKKKQGTNWNTKDVRQAASLQPGPLSKRKKDEPSFIMASQSTTFKVQGSRSRITLSRPNPEQNIIYPYAHFEEWKLLRSLNGGSYSPYREFTVQAFPETFITGYFGGSGLKNFRNLRIRFYVSFFEPLATDDDFRAVFVGVLTASVDVRSNIDESYSAWNKGYAVMGGTFNMITEIIANESINPLHAWQEDAPPGYFGFTYAVLVNKNPLWQSGQVACPVSPEYDVSRISQMPGYIKTLSFDFSEYPNPSAVPQTFETTIEF